MLVTNDDGVDSPALMPFARAMAGRHRTRVVVPDRERSWVAKAITRYEPVFVGRSDRDGVETWTCSGYPADAVQLGIHGLFDRPPEMVVAGINLGYNHGAGFLMSSGTVGATVEAWVSGIPAVAFSTGTTVDWPAWRRRVESAEAGAGWSRLSETCVVLLDEITGSGLLDHADVVSVNLPFDATPETPRRVTSIARVGYDRLFRQEDPGRFRHEFGGGLLEFAGLEGTDVDAARRGWASITPVRLPQAAEVPPPIVARLQAGG